MAKKSVRDYVNDNFSDEEKNLFNFIVESFPETVLIQDGEESEDILTILAVLAKVFGKARAEITNLSTSHSAEELYEKIQKGVLVDQNKMLLLPLAKELKYQGIDYELGLTSLLNKLAEERALVVDANMLVKNRGTALAVEQIIKNLAEQKNFDYTSYILQEKEHELDIFLNYVLEEFVDFEEDPVQITINEQEITAFHIIKNTFLFDIFMSIRPTGIPFNIFIIIALNILFNFPDDQVIAGTTKESELSTDVKFAELPSFPLTSENFVLIEEELDFTGPDSNNKYTSNIVSFNQRHTTHTYVFDISNLPNLDSDENILLPENFWNSEYYKISIIGYDENNTYLNKQEITHFKGLGVRVNLEPLTQDYWWNGGALDVKGEQVTTSTATSKVKIPPSKTPVFRFDHDSSDFSGEFETEELGETAYYAAVEYFYLASVPIAYLIAHFWDSEDNYIEQKVLKEVSGTQNPSHRLQDLSKPDHFVGDYIYFPLSASSFPNRANVRKVSLEIEKFSPTNFWTLIPETANWDYELPPLEEPPFDYNVSLPTLRAAIEAVHSDKPLGTIVRTRIEAGGPSTFEYEYFKLENIPKATEIPGIGSVKLINQYQVAVNNSNYVLPIKAWLSDGHIEGSIIPSTKFIIDSRRVTKTLYIGDEVELKRFFNYFIGTAPAHLGLFSYALTDPGISSRVIGAYFSERNDDNIKSDTVSEKVSTLLE